MPTIYLSRHGESIYNTEDRIGGNSNLSSKGKLYALKLADFINRIDILEIWTSKLIRTINTAILCNHPKTQFNELNEINAGDFEDLTYSEVKKLYLEEYNKRKSNKLKYRYNNGESYLDLIKRVTPIIDNALNVSDDKPLLIVAHQAILRVIYGKLKQLPQEEIPHLSIPLHTLFRIELNKSNFVVNEEKIVFEI